MAITYVGAINSLLTCSSLYLLSFCRAMLCKHGLCRHAVSVCVYVCLSRSWILPKRINISSKFFHHLVATPFYSFSMPNFKRHSNWSPPPLMGASNAGGVSRNRNSELISGFFHPSLLAVTSISSQCLSSLFLIELTDGASTTCWGSLFHALITRWLKKCFLMSKFGRSFRIFRLWPRSP